MKAFTSAIYASVSVVRTFVSSASFSSCNVFTVKWHWDILMFSNFFSVFLTIVVAFTPFTVDLSFRLFGITLSWRQRVLKWRWFFQPASFLVTFSSLRSVLTTSRSCCRIIFEYKDPVSWFMLNEKTLPVKKPFFFFPVYIDSISRFSTETVVRNSHRSCYSLCVT